MKIDIQRITEGDESVVIRYMEPNPKIERVIDILEGRANKLWGRIDGNSVCVGLKDVLYLESVDDKVFAYTKSRTLKIDGTLNSFMEEQRDDTFFRCSKSMVINVGRVSMLKSLSSNRIDATMESGEHIIISRRYASEFRRLLSGYGKGDR